MKNTKRKFFKATYTVVILSEDADCADFELRDLDYHVTEGDCVLRNYDSKRDQLTDVEMANELYEAGSDPGFFQLNEDDTHEDDKENKNE
jgi:hypothetical protein